MLYRSDSDFLEVLGTVGRGVEKMGGAKYSELVMFLSHFNSEDKHYQF